MIGALKAEKKGKYIKSVALNRGAYIYYGERIFLIYNFR